MIISRLRSMYLGLAVVLLSWCVPVAADSWSVDDTSLEMKGDRLYESGEFVAAEKVYRSVRDRHPETAAALLYHVKALIALKRYPEAVVESRQAVELGESNALAHEWLGISLLGAGQIQPAIASLTQALTLDPDEVTTQAWLICAQGQAGQSDKARELLDRLRQEHGDEEYAKTLLSVADAYRQMENYPAMVKWAEQSARLGNEEAVRRLVWAYDYGQGVPVDPGASLYWSLRADKDSPWVHSGFCAEVLVIFAHGWGLIGMAIFLAVVLPVILTGALGYVMGRRLARNASLHWAERARQAYAFQLFLGYATMLLPLLYLLDAVYYPGFFLPVPKWLLNCVIFLTVWISSHWVVTRLNRLYRTEPGTLWTNMQDTCVVVCLYGAYLMVFFVMQAWLPASWGWPAAMVLLAGLLAYFWLQFGGWIRLAHLIRLVVPAPPALRDTVAALARAQGQRAPSVWILRWQKANALAFPFANAVAVTRKALEVFNPDELNAVMAHELSHLCEDRMTRFIRLWLFPLVGLPLLTIGYFVPSDDFWYALLVCYLLLFLAFNFQRKRARRMEERADSHAQASEREAGAYARALAKLYESNLVPAVMPGNRKVHPHLYDRLLASGQTPDFSRPAPPSRWSLLPGFGLLLVHGAVLAAIWLLLFGNVLCSSVSVVK